MKYVAHLMVLLLMGCGPVWTAGLFFSSGSSETKTISLSFDDGPGPRTPEILDILDQYKIKAIFFVSGRQVSYRSEIARDILARGHELGCHTFDHTNLYAYKDTVPRDILSKDITAGLESIKKVTGNTPVFLRIPHGYYRPWVSEVAQEFNVDIVHWTFGCDWKNLDADSMVKQYIEALQPGAILLFHDGGTKKQRQKTVEILPGIITQAISAGYRIVPVSELLNIGSEGK